MAELLVLRTVEQLVDSKVDSMAVKLVVVKELRMVGWMADAKVALLE